MSVRIKDFRSGRAWIQIFALVLITISIFSFWKKWNFLENANRTSGKIVDIDRKESIGEDDLTEVTYYPVFSFVDQAQIQYRVRSRAGNNPARYSVGDTVEIGYLAQNPVEAEIIGEWMFWMAPVFSGIFGLILGVIAFPHRRNRENRGSS